VRVEEPELDSSFTDFKSAEKMISKMRISSNNSSIIAAAMDEFTFESER